MSGFVETLLKRFEDELRDQAVSAMVSPGNRDAFDYGRACGTYGGLHRAQAILKEMISEADDHDDTL